MADNARLTHVSPGVYSRETELSYAVKSLGITTLGLVGETKKGPAFQPISIESWRDFQSTFGGTSTEKYIGSQYPKYELPYIAKSYLSESNQLQVCRVLGLSGYNAGPAWVMVAKASENGGTVFLDPKNDIDGMVVAVLRSRGGYSNYNANARNGADTCSCVSSGYDNLTYYVGETPYVNCNESKKYNMAALKMSSYTSLNSNGTNCDGYHFESGDGSGDDSNTYFPANPGNYGRFKIVGITGEHDVDTVPSKEDEGYFEYAVSLNPNDNDYILKVLGTDPFNGETPIYVESLYDVAFQQLVDSSDLWGIKGDFATYAPYRKNDFCVLRPVTGFLRKQESSLTRKDIGKRFIADSYSVNTLSATCHVYDFTTNRPQNDEETSTVELGKVYTVRQFTDGTGKRHYFYASYNPATIEGLDASVVQKRIDALVSQDTLNSNESRLTLIENTEDGRLYRLYVDEENDIEDVYPVTCDMNDYKESYRFASTPWIVSSVKGDFDRIELNKLFRFHTISDGDAANNEVKISIANIRPDEGSFDVLVRDINDTDAYPMVYESYNRCTLVPGDNNYIAYRIGSYDGVYEVKSRYITVEVNENIITKNSIPAGFLGYPLSMFNGLPISGNTQNVKAPYLAYNLNYNSDIKNKKQFFGLSNLTGIDIDMFTYKGSAAYGQEPAYLSQGFHLDSRMSTEGYDEEEMPEITVDGVSGYKFDAVSINNRTNLLTETPIIGSEAEMSGSIYENLNLRKFTLYFYGGFDGWDIYRESRTNTDEYKITKYKGDYNKSNGVGNSFDRISNPEALNLNQDALTTDFYAYLAAARQFANPEAVDINVFATPGIDLVNHTLLSQEIIDMLEEERADSIYVAVTPDKPMGASDYVDEMYTADEVVAELESTDIESNYTCTYYPWIKCEDTDNNQYIYLSPTKDAVRNMVMTDNTAYPWFAPAGISRGDVDCIKAHYITKLADEDVLYEGRINPVKTFATDGVKLWGQKNLQKGDAQLTRIAVRRLLLRMRKLIAIACNGLIFEPNDNATRQKFLSTVTPIMDNIKANRGISDYRIEVDDSVEARERRELPAKIYFKPFTSLEYISLDFIVTPESVNFDSI